MSLTGGFPAPEFNKFSPYAPEDQVIVNDAKFDTSFVPPDTLNIRNYCPDQMIFTVKNGKGTLT